VQAITPVVLYALPADDLLRLVGDGPDPAPALLRDFAIRLDRMTNLVEDLSLRTVRGRLAHFLLEQAEAGVVTRRWRQDEIAARLGTVRDVLGRTLRAFADEGLVHIERQPIPLLDRDRLQAEAEE
jgi:CRP/FNR family transcriptional regulator